VFVVAGVMLSFSMFRLGLRISPWAIALPIGLLAGAAWFGAQLYELRCRPPSSLASVVCTLLVVYASVVVFAFPAVERMRPTPEIGRWIASHDESTEAVGLLDLEQWEASLRYYSGRRVIRLDDEAALRAFLAKSSTAVVVMRRRDYQALQRAGLRLRVLFGRDAVVGMSGRGLRRQLWGRLLVVARDETS
jgi:hypothetical protein